MNKITFVRGLAVVAGLALFGAGCNPFARVEQKIGEAVAERAIEAVSGGDVDIDGDNGFTVGDPKTGDVASWGTDVKLPSGFSEVLPRYPSGTVITASIQNKGKSGSFVQVIESDGNEVLGWYDEQLKRGGFELESEMTLGVTVRQYEKVGMKISISVMSEVDEESGKMTTNLTAAYDEASG